MLRGMGIETDIFREEVKKILDADGRTTPFTNNLPGIHV
jgi:hypothetical protein